MADTWSHISDTAVNRLWTKFHLLNPLCSITYTWLKQAKERSTRKQAVPCYSTCYQHLCIFLCYVPSSALSLGAMSPDSLTTITLLKKFPSFYFSFPELVLPTPWSPGVWLLLSGHFSISALQTPLQTECNVIAFYLCWQTLFPGCPATTASGFLKKKKFSLIFLCASSWSLR